MALCLMDHKKGKNMGQDNQLNRTPKNKLFYLTPTLLV